jgi:hypothetical protein
MSTHKRDDSENQFWLAWLCLRQYMRHESNYNRQPWWFWRLAWTAKAGIICLLGRIWVPQEKWSVFGHEHVTACIWNFHAYEHYDYGTLHNWQELTIAVGWRCWHAHIQENGT